MSNCYNGYMVNNNNNRLLGAGSRAGHCLLSSQRQRDRLRLRGLLRQGLADSRWRYHQVNIIYRLTYFLLPILFLLFNFYWDIYFLSKLNLSFIFFSDFPLMADFRWRYHQVINIIYRVTSILLPILILLFNYYLDIYFLSKLNLSLIFFLIFI